MADMEELDEVMAKFEEKSMRRAFIAAALTGLSSNPTLLARLERDKKRKMGDLDIPKELAAQAVILGTRAFNLTKEMHL